MFSNQYMKRVASGLAFIGWLLSLMLALIEQYYHTESLAQPHIPFFIKGLLLNMFVLGTYFFCSIKAREHESTDLHELIWQVFLTALVCTVFSGIVSFLNVAIEFNHRLPSLLFSTLSFHVEMGLATVLLLTAFAIWKRMVLYEKRRFALFSWFGFETVLLATLVIHFFRIGKVDIYFNAALVFFVVWTVVVSVNLKWVPQLVFNQKLISIFQLIVVLFCLAYFLASITSYYNNEGLLVDDLSKNIFFSALFVFVVFYAVASLLVVIFNLPTSSVFEQKIKELAIFQELSESLNNGKDEEQIFGMLLSHAAATVNADAAWLQTTTDNRLYLESVDEEKAMQVKDLIRKSGYDRTKPKRLGNRTLFRRSTDYEFRSMLAVPLISGSQHLGDLVLLKRMANAFDNTMVSMVKTFVAQASIAIHNFNLIKQVIENERFKNELAIAKSVQARLLPTKVYERGPFDFHARSEFAKEVGGDYYDFHKISDTRYVFIIADVAGKGVPAAFNMAQMKGVFQAMVRLGMSPSDFMDRTNAALSNCLERNAFITATYLELDTELRTINIARAGHCPTFIYKNATGQVETLDSGGLGLGIIRNGSYKPYVSEETITFEKGDLLMLYTDGLIEAKNAETGEEFGYDRLSNAMHQNVHLPLDALGEQLLNDIQGFMQDTSIADDYTLVLLRF